MSPELRKTTFRVSLQIGLPQPYYRPTTGSHVSVLRQIQSHSPKHAGFGARAAPVMPVVAVELDGDVHRRHECVRDKLASKHPLSFVLHSKPVQEPVTYALRLRRLAAPVHGMRLRHVGPPSGAFVPAGHGTVTRITFLAPGSRPCELGSANRAYVPGFGSALVHVPAGIRAKAGPSRQPPGARVERAVTDQAVQRPARPPGFLSAGPRAPPVHRLHAMHGRLAEFAGSCTLGPHSCGLATNRAKTRSCPSVPRDVKRYSADDALLVCPDLTGMTG